MTSHQEIKSILDLKTTLEGFGLVFKKKGSNYQTCCPFHEEKTASFSIKAGADFYNCFGCQIKGDIFTFLEHFLHLDKQQALFKAADLAGVVIPKKGPKKKERKRSVSELIRLEAARFYFLHIDKPGAKQYLKSRNHKPDIIRKMKVGWNPGGIIEHLKKKEFSEEDIIKAGFRDQHNNIFAFFPNDVIIFPHFIGEDVASFTMKDPSKQKEFQWRAKDRDKDWHFYNQDVLKKYKEIILVEGENDLLSLMDAGYSNVICMIGGISEEQLKYLYAHLKNKTLFIWADKDPAGFQYIRRISDYLDGLKCQVSIITHPGETKDPDEFIQNIKADPRKQIKDAIDKSLTYIYWEIEQAERLPDLKDKIEHFEDTELFEKISFVEGMERDAVFHKLLQVGFSGDSLNEELSKFDDLKKIFDTKWVKGLVKNENANSLAMTIFTYFQKVGKFFFNSTNKASLLYKGKIYQISDNPFFNPLIMFKTGLNYKLTPAPAIWEALRSYAIIHGVKIEQLSWLHTDFKQDSIFINPNMPDNKILKVSPGKIEEIENGLNDDHVLLSGCPMMNDFEFRPDVNIKDGMNLLKELFFQNLACDVKQRYWIVSWMIMSFLIDFSHQRPIAKFSGSSASGKSTAIKLISYLLYGQNHVGLPTPAAAFATGTENPLVILDNIENDILPKYRDFLLQAVGEGSKIKRAIGSDTKVVHEKVKCIVATTAIEPFDRPELINRTWDFEFTKIFHSKDFLESAIIRKIEKNRNLILSTILKFISEEILTNTDRIEELYKLIKLTFQAHPKDRTDDSLCLLMFIMEKLTNYFPLNEFDPNFTKGSDQAEVIRSAWIGYQKSIALDSETGSSHCLTLLNSLVKEIRGIVREDNTEHLLWNHPKFGDDFKTFYHPDLKIEVAVSKKITIENKEKQQYRMYKLMVTSSTLHDVFSQISRNLGRPYMFRSCQVLTQRMKNDHKILKDNGWDIPLNDKGNISYHHIIKGTRRILLTKLVYE